MSRGSANFKRVERLAGHLTAYKEGRGCPHCIDLTQAAILPGWWIQRNRIPRTSYLVTMPADRDPVARWGAATAQRSGDREWLVGFLRKHWIPDAERWMEEIKTGGRHGKKS